MTPYRQRSPRGGLFFLYSDAMCKSAALESIWHCPIVSSELQAELDRIVRDSRRPEMLAELFSVLGNDPELIAECPARPVDRSDQSRLAVSSAR